MRFDAPTFARAWLSVAQASGVEKDLPVLNRTIAIEEYVHGVRLVATDRFILLTAWVPNVDTDTDTEPQIDEAPDRTVIAADLDSRGKSLLNYVQALHSRAEKDGGYIEGSIPLRIMFDVRLPAGQDGDQSTLDGLEPLYTVFEVPDVEKVYLDVVQAEWLGWRTLVHGFVGEVTDKITLNPHMVERVAKVRRWSEGSLSWLFGGPDRVALVDFVDSDPHVSGLVMPIRLLVDGEDPDPQDDAA